MPRRARLLSALPLLLLAAVAALGLPGCDLFGDDGPSGPRLEGIPGKIVYSAPVERESDGGPQIFVTDQEGTRQLTSTDTPYEYAVTPAFSPDGEQIVYGRGDGTGAEELYVMNADGSGKRPLIEDPPFVRKVIGIYPVWSPSGDRVAFQRCITCNFGGTSTQLFVADLRSGRVDTLTGWASDNAFPTWSPDGERIAFISDRAYVDSEENRGDTDLYVMDADGSNVQRLTSSGRVGILRWSPSSDKIAYAYAEIGAQPFLYDTTRGESREIETGLTGKVNLVPAAWSPNEDQLLLTAGDYPDLQPYVLNMDTGETEQVFSRSGGLRVADWHAE